MENARTGKTIRPKELKRIDWEGVRYHPTFKGTAVKTGVYQSLGIAPGNDWVATPYPPRQPLGTAGAAWLPNDGHYLGPVVRLDKEFTPPQNGSAPWEMVEMADPGEDGFSFFMEPDRM